MAFSESISTVNRDLSFSTIRNIFDRLLARVGVTPGPWAGAAEPGLPLLGGESRRRTGPAAAPWHGSSRGPQLRLPDWAAARRGRAQGLAGGESGFDYRHGDRGLRLVGDRRWLGDRHGT